MTLPLDALRKIAALLSRREQRQVCWLFLGILAMSLVEVVGVVSILPFLAVIARPDVIGDSRVLSWLYNVLQTPDRETFIVYLGGGVFLSLVGSNACRALTTWAILRFTQMREYTISKRFLIDYVRQPYLFFASRNSSELSKNILSEIQVMINGVLMPVLETVARAVVVVTLAGMLLVVDPVLALSMCALLGGMYAIIYVMAQRKLLFLSGIRTVANGERYQSISELFGGIKEIKVLGREDVFIRRYARSMRGYSESQVSCLAIAQMPKFALEVVVFGGLLFVVLYFLAIRRDVSNMLPLVGLYALAGYRIMPSLQSIFHSITRIKFYIPSVDILYEDLQRQGGIHGERGKSLKAHHEEVDELAFVSELELKNVRFAYSDANSEVLRGLTLRIQRKTTVAFVGSTGAGKTTIIDIILGLITPSSGTLSIDGIVIDARNRRSWQNRVGYVPQQIFLADDSIRRNIAFGLDDDCIDQSAVERAAHIANLHGFVNGLDAGYDTIVGERGVRLSGGQRQRIGIARALYHNPDVLIMDEGTSSLDGITENAVMQAIDRLSRDKTIIIVAHRLSTVRNCDRIYLFEQGEIVADGTYEQLMQKNERFRLMANIGKANPSALRVDQ